MVVATVILLFACAAVSNCVGPDIYSDSDSPGENCHVVWNYDRDNKTKGPFCWDTFAPKCDGERQSPINIETKKVSHMLFSPSYENNTADLTGEIIIKERAPRFVINRSVSSYNLSGVPFHLDKEFALIQFHMHFHKDNGKGSEHRINCNGYDGEKEKNKKTYDGLGPFFDSLIYATQCGPGEEKREPDHVGPLEFLEKPGALYRYEGSLTTPTCDETVIWLIRDKPVIVSETDFKKLYNLKWDKIEISENGNVRPPFPMNDRKVYANFNVRNGENNENHKDNNNDENNGQKCTEWYESRQCSTDHHDDDDD